jgi:Tol biopolymer transport system component
VADRKFKTVTQITSGAFDHNDAAFSPDGKTITFDAFDSVLTLEQIFTVSTAAPFTETKIPTPGFDAFLPVLTPDGKAIVFTDNTTDIIESVNIATGVVTQLSLPPASVFDFFAVVSPDGKHVSFTREDCTGTPCVFNIFVMPIAGETVASPATSLTEALPTADTSTQPLYLDNSRQDIVYMSNFPNIGTVALPGTGNDNIFEMDRHGTTTTQLTHTVLEDSFNIFF